MPSATWQRLNPRERRVVLGGAAVSVAAFALAFVILPFWDRWTDREAAISGRLEQMARLEGLLRSEDTIRGSLKAQEEAQGPLRNRVLIGATPAVAASVLQTLVQEYADSSRVVLDRIDVVAEPKAGATGLPEIPAHLSGQGDIGGLAALLSLLQHGGKLLVIDEIRVSSGLGTEESENLLTWSIRLHGPYLAE